MRATRPARAGADAILAAAEGVLLAAQGATHAPWWLAIVGSTAALRVAVTLPLAVYQQRRLARLELLAPEMRRQTESLAAQLMQAARKSGLTTKDAGTLINRQVGRRQEGRAPCCGP